jgi:hypothetical protein
MSYGLLQRSVAVLATASALLVGGGCPREISVEIPHPLTHGGIAPNRLPNPDPAMADRYGLPLGTFQDDASLAVLDAQRVCFNVALRTVGDQAELATLHNWRVFLRGDPNIENMSPVFGQPAELSDTIMQGSVLQQQYAGTYTSCTRYSYGVSCNQYPRYITVRVPAQVHVIQGGGAVCFAHGGTINRATREITLHMDHPRSVATRVAFRWRFVP